MKTLQVFILLFLTSFTISISACGFYPYGEDIRFCFTHPNNFGYRSFSEFDYSSTLFYPNSEGVYNDDEVHPNDKLWFDYCQEKVAITEIVDGLYRISVEELTPKSTNIFVQYLYQNKDFEAIEYLKFAKSIEIFNQQYEDPWERSSEWVSIENRSKAIDFAVANSKKVTSKEIQNRYIFQAIRLAFYNKQFEAISKLFDANFANSKQKDIIYYWSLYFKTKVEADDAKRSFYAAQVFANAPDKRFVVFYDFSNQININSIINFATSNEECANVYALAAIRKHDRALDYIEKVYQNKPSHEALSFLLLREVNKIEDWIFTPYFTYFEPSIVVDSYTKEETDFSETNMKNRINEDKKYAKKVYKFSQKVTLEKVKNPNDWKIFKIQLLFAMDDFSECLAQIHKAENDVKTTVLQRQQLQRTKALCLLQKQTSSASEITSEIETIILENKNNAQFLFAAGKILEMKKNTTNAALLFSAIDNNQSYMTWKSSKNKTQSYGDYFTNYFQYIDRLYTNKDVKNLISNIEKNAKKTDAFSVWKYAAIKNDIPRLYDLLGTQYIRKNDLKKALYYFDKVDEKHWNKTNWLWQRRDSIGNYFDENPFYDLKYTPNFIANRENFALTKKSVTSKLIEYIAKADDKNEPNRDLYYFLVGNCYYNMTINGNAWMMRRYGVSANDVEPYPEDENEFRNGLLAKKYYQLAYKNAKTKKFKALCLRLMGKFESFEIFNKETSSYKGDSLDSYVFNKNKIYKKLQKNYPNSYDDLIYGCTAFEDYFKARR